MGFSAQGLMRMLQGLPQKQNPTSGPAVMAPLRADKTEAQPQPAPAAPQTPAPQPAPGGRSIFDLIMPARAPQFDVRAATGTKPKNYTPTSVTMSGMPAASVFQFNPGAASANPFTVIAATGTKGKNYKPTQVLMNAPSLAGPAAMQQMLALMQGGATPFAPYGQGQG